MAGGQSNDSPREFCCRFSLFAVLGRGVPSSQAGNAARHAAPWRRPRCGSATSVAVRFLQRCQALQCDVHMCLERSARDKTRKSESAAAHFVLPRRLQVCFTDGALFHGTPHLISFAAFCSRPLLARRCRPSAAKSGRCRGSLMMSRAPSRAQPVSALSHTDAATIRHGAERIDARCVSLKCLACSELLPIAVSFFVTTRTGPRILMLPCRIALPDTPCFAHLYMVLTRNPTRVNTFHFFIGRHGRRSPSLVENHI
jgi:hypothetical protein